MTLVFIVSIPVVALLLHQIATVSKHTVNISDEDDVAVLCPQFHGDIWKDLLDIEPVVGAEFVIYTVQWKTDVSVERINLVLNSLEIACSVINQWRIRWCQ